MEVGMMKFDFTKTKSFHENKNDVTTKEKSDGGSSNYYKLKLPEYIARRIFDDVYNEIEPVIEVGEVIDFMLGDSFIHGNILKAIKRIYECEQGRGKIGTDISYDIKKIRWFLSQLENRNE